MEPGPVRAYGGVMSQTVGPLLRSWRRRRNLSQLALADRADVSARHLSFIETGRSRPSPDMVLRLCGHLDVPLREQNRLLLASGHAPAHPEHDLGDPSMAEVNAAIEAILAAYDPFPALIIDQGWDLVSANDAVYGLLDGVDPALLEPPVNVLRLSLHPHGLAPRIVNFGEWRDHLLRRLQREYDASGAPRLAALLAELGGDDPSDPGPTTSGLVVPLQLRVGDRILSLLSTTTVFGTPREVTLAELAIEAFLPADAETRAALA